MIGWLKRRQAQRKLQQIVNLNRNSFACQDYRKRRAAALKHTRKAA